VVCAAGLLIVLVSIMGERPNSEDALKVEQKTSDFDLKTDFIDFKVKMTELDTIKIFINHSVCTFEGYERMELTKQSDSIKIRSEYRNPASIEIKDPNWSLVYEKKVSVNDTIWPFGTFLERNSNRQVRDKIKRGTLVLTHKLDTIAYSTDGLVDLNNFFRDYYETMRKIFPENKNGIYGFEIIEE